MGTKIQTNAFLPECRSVIDLDGTISSGIRSLYRENDTMQNGHNPDSLTSPIYQNGFLGNDTGKVRQTILKHELIFRNQLQELHRLYRKQQELMSEIKRREINKDDVKEEKSLSSSLFSPVRPEDAKRTWNIPHSSSLCSRAGCLSTSGASNKLFSIFLKEKRTAVFSPQQDTGSLRTCRSLFSKSSVLPKRTYDLEGPADVCPNNAEKQMQDRVSKLPRVEGTSRNALDGMNGGGSLFNLGSRSESSGKEHLSDGYAETRQFDEGSSTGDFCSGKSLTFPQSVLAEPRNELLSPPLDMGKLVSKRKRTTIFGVELSEGYDDPLNASSKDLINSGSSPCPFWKKESITLDQKVRRHPENRSVASFKSPSWIANSFLQNLDLGGTNANDVKNERSNADLKDEISSQNRLTHPEMNGKCLHGSSSIGLNLFKVSDHHTESDPKTFSKPAEILKRDSEISQKRQQMVPQHSPVLADFQSRLENPLKGGLPWFLRSPQNSVMKNSYFMNLDSLQNCSEKFFRKAEIADGSLQTLKEKNEISAPISGQDAKDRKIDFNHGTTAKRIPGFPISNMLQSSMDLNSWDSLLEANCSETEDDNAGKVKKDEDVPKNQLRNKDLVLQKGLNSYKTDLKHHIDLNFSLHEEDAPSAPSLPTAVLKLATTEIDLETPMVTEFETDASPEEANSRKTAPGKSEVSYEECDKIAAQAIIAISLFGRNNLVDDCTSNLPKAASSYSLKWFAEIVSSQCAETTSMHIDVSLDENGACDDEESVPNGMDYFEFMTLKLEDTKEDHYCYKMEGLNNQSDEEAGGTTSSKGSRRGQPQRGRQRIDFQKDVLPGLVTLSRHEVTEDLQAFEELVKPEGVALKFGLSQRNNTRNGKGRKRSGGTTTKAPCKIPTQQPSFQLGGRSLTGWGKRTRRLPRQRCPNAYLSFSIKC